MAQRTVLVTGAAGFIGSHVSEALVARGDRVIGLDSFDDCYDPRLKRANLAQLMTDEAFELIEGDVRDPDALGWAFYRRPDAVVHLAARGGVRSSIADPEGYMDCNVRGTLRVLQAAVRHDVGTFIFGSSSSVYGASNTVPFSEEQPTDRPLSPYAASKIAAEALCHTWHHLYSLSVICLRFFTVYGPRQRPDLAINRFVRLMRAGEAVPQYGDGSSLRDYTYVADIVRGVVAALELPADYEVINLGGDAPVSLAELIRLVAEALGVEPRVEVLPEQPGDVPCTWADISKAQRLLGWRPEWSLREGLREFIRWWDAQPAAHG